MPTSFETARQDLKARGIILKQEPNEYCINFRHGGAWTKCASDYSGGRQFAGHSFAEK